MRFKKWILSLLAAMMTLFVGIGVAACDEDEPDQPIVEGPETGVFYYDDVLTNREYRIVLSKGNQVIFLVSDKNETGVYTAENGNLSFTFVDFTASAKYADDALILTYGNSQMTFNRAIEYTVTFDSAQGSAVAAQTVLNGRTAEQPATPVREGYTFIGWYEDAAYTVPYSFAANAVRENKTLYAYWGKNGTTGREFNVKFDLGYTAEGVTAPAAQQTNGGVLYTVETPAAREGYTFAGWWVSEEDEADKLTYRFVAGETVLNENVTLFALWTPNTTGDKLATPLLSVTENGLTWNAVAGATGYEVYVDGEKAGDVSECEYSAAKAFANLDENKTQHEFKVIAKGGTAEKNSDAAVRYYTPNALARVSIFNVTNSMLTFAGVENAEEYFITVICGNEDHNHTNVALGGNYRSFNLYDCAMKENGIEIVVTAKAEGYVTSVSHTYYYNRVLAEVENLAYDEATQTVTWKAVPDAASYVVTVNCGDTNHVIEKKNVGNATSFDLQYCAPKQGGIAVSVYPVTKGYNSPAATELTVNKTKLATPNGLTLNGETLTWAGDPNATSYEVVMDGVTKTTTTNEYELANVVDSVTVKVRAIAENAANNSEWSAEKVYEYNGAPKNLAYANGILTWDKVLGATQYTVTVNGEVATCTDNSFVVAARGRAGENVITVSAAGAATTINVYLYKVTLDVNGGTPLADTEWYRNGATYVAYGDYLTLPAKGSTAVKVGNKVIQELSGWYAVKDGVAANARKYENGIFDQTSNLTLYAGWIGATYELTLNKGNEGATLTQASVEVTFGKTTKFPVPVLEGYAFGGWYTAANGEGTAITDENGNMLQAWNSITDTLYAFWLQPLEFKLEENGKSYAVVAGKDISLVTQVTVPAKYKDLPVDTIRSGAFKDCKSLQVINLPDTMKVVGSTTDVVSSGPFSGCKALTAVNVYETGLVVSSDSNYYSVDGTLINRLDGKIRLAYVPLAKTGAYAIPEGVEEIPTRLFANSYVREVTIPSSVTRIGENAFCYSKNLVSVTFANPELDADGATVQPLTIANNAFRSCSALREITLPKRLEKMADSKGASYVSGVFDGCSSLVSIRVTTGNAHYTDVNGILCDTNATAIYCPFGRGGTVDLTNVQKVADEAFKARTKITKVFVSFDVQSIGKSAFESCSALKEVVFEGSSIEGATTIGERAFYGCKALTAVTFQEECNVKTIGKSAFANNGSLRTLKLSNAIEEVCDSAFADCTSLKSVEILGGGDADTKFGDYVFNGCAALKTILLSDKVTDISLSMFNGCENLEEVLVDANNATYKSVDGVLYTKDGTTILYCAGKNVSLQDETTGGFKLPAGVTKIGAYAFAGHSGLKKIEIGALITEIGDHAFENCFELTAVDIVDGTTELTIGNSAFENCNQLSKNDTLTLANRVTALGVSAFQGAGIKGVVLGTGLKTIGEKAFAKTDLTEIVIPATVESFGDYLFSGCINLTTATINASVQTLTGTFEGCTALTSVTVGEGLVTIGEKAFYEAGANAAAGFTFVIPATVETIGKNAFAESGIASVTIPAKTATIKAGAFYKTAKLTALTFAATAGDANKVALTIEDGTSTTGAFAESKIAAIVLPERLTEIGNYAFYANDELTSLTVENANGDLTKIGDYAFSSCTDIQTLTLSEKLEEIGKSAFAKLQKLQTLVIPSSVLKIGVQAFNNGQFTALTFAAGGEGELSIGEDAFANNTKLENVTLPRNLSTLHRDAFYNDTVLKTYALLAATGESAATEETTQYGFKVEDGILYHYKDGKCDDFRVPANYAGFFEEDGKTAKVFKVHDDVTALDDYAFYNTKIQKIDLNKVQTIGSSAFTNSALTEVTIPLSVTEIESSAFKTTKQLTSLTFEKAAAKENEKDYKALTIGNSAFEASVITALEIPKRVISIGSSAFKSNKLQSVTFEEREEIGEDNITKDITIGSSAFETTIFTTIAFPEGMTTLERLFSSSSAAKVKNVTIPSTVTTIGSRAFYAVKSMTTVTFAKTPAGAEAQPLTIGYDAFISCTGLKTIELPARTVELGAASSADSLGGVFSGCSALTDFTLEKVTTEDEEKTAEITTLYNKTFYGCTKLKNLELPSSLKEVGNRRRTAEPGSSYSVFYNCNALTTVTIPDSVTTVHPYVFNGGTTLSTVTLGAGMTELPENFFYGCKALTAIKVSENNKNFVSVDGVLYDNTKTALLYYPAKKSGATFTVPDTVKTIKKYAFGRSSTDYALNPTTINLPVGLETIDEYAFYYDKKAQKINFAKGTAAMTIGKYAFGYCTALQTIAIPENVTSIGDYAFANCTAVTGVTFENLEDETRELTIGSCAFQYLKHKDFTSLELPKRLESMGTYVFRGCTYLDTIDLSAATNLTKIPGNAFADCAIQGELVIPKSVTQIGSAAFSAAKITSVEFPAALERIDSTAFKNCKSLQTVTFIPNEKGAYALTYLGYSTFEGCTSLTMFAIPESVKSIPATLFSGCTNLETVTFAEDITSIGGSAFKNCEKLKSIAIDEFNYSLTSIGANAFDGCTAMEEFVIPAGLTSLGTDAFENTTMTIGVSSESISFIFDNGVVADVDKTKILAINIDQTTGTFTVFDTMETIGDGVFRGTHFSKIVLHDGITSIGNNAFRDSDVEEIVWGDSLKTIGTYAFAGTKLTSATIGRKVTSIGANAFYNAKNLTELNFVKGGVDALQIGKYAFAGTNIEAVEFPNRLKNVENKTTGGGYTSYSVTYAIGDYAFDNVTSLQSLTFEQESAIAPAGEMTIGDYAFRNTSITSLQLPSCMGGFLYYQPGNYSVTYYCYAIGNYAFYGCEKLETIDFGTPKGGGLSSGNYYYLGNSAFENCTSLGKNGETLVLPETTYFSDTKTGAYAFRGCTSLQSLRLSARGASIVLSTKDGSASYSGPTAVFENCTALETVTIVSDGQNTSNIGTRWFSGCYNLQTVTFPKKLWGIGKEAFSGCTALTDISEIPADCMYVLPTAFEGCTSLSGLTIDSANKRIKSIDDVLYLYDQNDKISMIMYYPETKTDTEYVVLDETPVLAANVFSGNKTLKKVTLPEGMTELSTNAFSGCTALEEVVLPTTLTKIGNKAFYECTALTTIALPDALSEIGSNAFYECSSLANVTLPKSLTTIGGQAFSGTAVTAFGLADENIHFEVDGGVLYKAGKTEIVAYPAGSTATEYNAPAALTTVATYAFAGAKNLQNVSFTAATDLATVNSYAFAGSSVVSVDFGTAEYTLGNYAFSDCVELTTVKLGDLKSASYKMFINCVKLKSLDVSEKGTLYSSVYGMFSGCTALEEINVDSANTTYSSVDGVLYNKAGDTLIYFPAANVKAMELTDGLKTFVIPEAVTTISTSAFEATKLEKVVFGSQVVTLNSDVFINSTTLRKADLSKATKLTSIKGFSGCTALEEVLLPETEGDVKIDKDAFAGCAALRELTLPTRLTNIGLRAFDGCTALKKIYVSQGVGMGDAQISSATSIDSIFGGWTSAQAIYFADDRVPSEWMYAWNKDCNARIVWGASVEDYEAGV